MGISDPGERAAARLEREEARERAVRLTSALAVVALAVAVPLFAEPLLGEPGATVGAVVGALLLLGLAVAVWPYDWSSEERRHRRLAAIWHELRSDADLPAQWDRYAVWAEPTQGAVELALIRCRPATDRGSSASPYSREVVRLVDAEDVSAAAEAMEELRALAAERELKARERFEQAQADAERRTREAMLAQVDKAAATEIESREEQMRRELAREEAAEKQAQAEAVARALRKP